MRRNTQTYCNRTELSGGVWGDGSMPHHEDNYESFGIVDDASLGFLGLSVDAKLLGKS